ncbi:hypothetical protein [Paenibacillus cremeus]|uniref:Glycosyl hydrolase family 32 N-terminal domain-containing protein n=1 Tax=Paenibacillus cremeus TaxID=2163881 RepID=A0A559K7D0_9BACL|nr:hypothetical protein [Paenibacillus cremeus]TVY08039.1 hypothetical protein FPZ49_20785 [Paenibacillus cremeus]
MSDPKREVLRIGNRVELFVDDTLIHRMEKAYLKLNPPEKKEIVLTMDQPWEGSGSGIYCTVFKEGDKYRMYYRGTFDNSSDHSHGQACCYAESSDGIHWERPELGIHEFNGSTRNNIVMLGQIAHNFSPFLDTRPGVPTSEKYKAVAGYAPRGLFTFVSEDGFHFRKLQEGPVLTKGAFDSHNLAYWDTERNSYICYSRYFASSLEPNIEAPQDSAVFVGVRAIQYSTSEDFIHWTEPQPNRYDRGPLEHFYTNSTVPCPGAEHIYLSFPMRFMPERFKIAGHSKVGISDNTFMSSRDGMFWKRPFREAWTRPGLDPRNWTQRSSAPAWGILETSPEEFSLFINEHYQWDDSRIRRVTVPRHRFASVHGDYTGGIFTTKLLVVEGNTLSINYATSAPGSVKVGLIDDAGWPISHFSTEDCDIIYGDELEHTVTWRGNSDLSQFIGKAVRLKFELKDADIYAMQIGAES